MFAVYKNIKTSEKTKLTSQKQVNIFPTFQKVQNLMKQGRIEEANNITHSMSPEDFRIYKLLKNKLNN